MTEAQPTISDFERRRQKIFHIIQIGNRDDFISRAFDWFISIVIVSNIAVMTLLTFDELSFAFPLMHRIEVITILIFCVEYALRIWTADLLYPTKTRFRAILTFLLSPDGIIDLFTILPFFFLSGFVVFRMLRVVRIFHLFRINAQYDSFHVITTVLKEKKNQIVSSVFILMILMLASSIGMYSAEHEAQPEAFQNAFSGIWWSVSALLTVGYGDIYPITVMGKIMAIFTAFLGVGVVAIPTGIISAGFVEQYTRIKHISTITKESSLRFVTLQIHSSHDWKNKQVRDTHLPQGLILALILRKGDVLVPRGDTMLLENDKVILGAESYVDEADIKLKEITIKKGHPFVNCAIRNLDISRLTTIVTIRRKNKMIIPNGSTVIQENDHLIVYSRHADSVTGIEIDL